MMHAVFLIVSLALPTLSQSNAAGPGTDDGGGFVGNVRGNGGIDIGYTQEQAKSLADSYPPGATAANPTSWYEYAAVIVCPQNTPDNPQVEICGAAVQFCETYAPDSPGPQAYIYRRQVGADGSEGSWEPVGSTCFTPSVPARSGAPAVQLTEAMIVEAFHRTDFALPQVSIEPPDNRTLVNLPVYFELVWPDAGFAPQEIDTVAIVGRQVRIKPTLAGVTYHAGDGTDIGPTTSLGGPYPGGDITHEYARAGTVNPSITVEYGGEYSVDGGAWTTVPGSATIDGPAVDLQVLTSKNRLYDN